METKCGLSEKSFRLKTDLAKKTFFPISPAVKQELIKLFNKIFLPDGAYNRIKGECNILDLFLLASYLII